MKAFVNRNLITQTDMDSGALTVHGTLVHVFSDPGDHWITVTRNDETVRKFLLEVNPKHPSMRVDIDLHSLDRPSELGGRGDTVCLAPGGRAFFYVSSGAGGYAVVAMTDGPKGMVVFDSRVLQKGDFFVANPIRPGDYSIIEAISGSRGKLVVDYPEYRRRRVAPLEAASVSVGRDTLKPDSIQIKPMQGVAFEIQTKSRIQLKLEKPDDRPRQRHRRPGALRLGR